MVNLYSKEKKKPVMVICSIVCFFFVQRSVIEKLWPAKDSCEELS